MTKLNLKLVMMLLGVIALTTVFNACSDDDDNNISKTNIVGKWTTVKIMVNDKEEVLADYDCETKKDYIEFLSNRTLLSVNYDKNCKEKTNKKQWNLSGDTLTIQKKNKGDTYTSTFKVKSLTSSSMILESIENGKEVPTPDSYPMDNNNKNKKSYTLVIYLKRIK